MPTPVTRVARHVFVSALISIFCLLPMIAGAQERQTGSLEGRVFNPASGEYTELARVTVEGTTLEAFTDVDGRYRLNRVPVGGVQVKVFYTGAVFEAKSAVVSANATTQLDFDWMASSTQNGVVTLEKLTVKASREMSGAATAINTQRFAPNTMTVVSIDEFGPVASNNIGEVLRSVPGLSVELGALGQAASISINGAPSNNVPVTIDGLRVADASNGVGSRVSAIHQLAVNNMSRIEVVFTPTPETTGSALAGTVNLVPRSAFERQKPLYTFGAAMMLRGQERSFAATPGPSGERTRKITPDLNFAAVVPVSPRFGFTLSGNDTTTFIPSGRTLHNWRGVFSDTNGGTLPDTTPDQPYLTITTPRDGIVMQKRATFAASIDLKLGEAGRLRWAVQHGIFNSRNQFQELTYDVGRVLPGNFSPSFTRGVAGAGTIRQIFSSTDQEDLFWMHSLNWHHTGRVWKAEAGLGLSTSDRATTPLRGNGFGNATSERTGVTVEFADVGPLRPGRITVTDGTTGQAVDPAQLANYRLVSAGGSTPVNASIERRVFGNLERDFDGRVPFTVKTGFEISESIRDTRGGALNYTFLGADGIAANADNVATPFFDPDLSARSMPFDFPSIERVTPVKVYERFVASPTQFTTNDVTTYNAKVAASKRAAEIITAAYLRVDTELLGGRLKLVGGLRAEQTNIDALGQLTDPTRNFQRAADGTILRGTNGQPLLLQTAGSLAAVQLTNVERGLVAQKEYLRWFPSLNATYNITENLIARAGYFHSVGRPPFAQYAGALTLPNLSIDPSPTNRIVVSNAGIKAWDARTYKLSLEYYFKEVGLLSVSGFVRDVRNFFGETLFPATDEFLGLYGLDPDIYGQFNVATQYNLPGTVRLTGVDVNYKQSLTFLPAWARGVQVFANGSAQRVTGESAEEFSGYIPRSANWGVSLTREKFTLRARWNYTSRSRTGLIAAGRSIGPDTYNWRAGRTLVSLSGDYRFSRRLSLYANWTNVGEEPDVFEISGPLTPAVAQVRDYRDYGSLLTLGLNLSL